MNYVKNISEENGDTLTETAEDTQKINKTKKLDKSKYKEKDKNNLFCGNCGKKGHVYRKCIAPITSLGIIVFRINPENQREYLMIRRRDTLGFVEFMRGKYNLTNYSYIYNLFSIMTKDERERLINNSFDELWNDLWMNKNNRQYHNEYENSKKKFVKLKEGFKGSNNEIVSLQAIHNTQPVIWSEPEWGFPKGRRNLRETDFECARREFREETGLDDTDYLIKVDLGRIEETFHGTNNIRYRHIYFIGFWDSNKEIGIDKNNFSQISEIGNIGWFNFNDAYEVIRSYNREKKRLLKNLDYALDNV